MMVMKTSAYITNADIGVGTGGGIVSLNESLALSNVTMLKASLSKTDIDPSLYHLANVPFLYDYLAWYKLLGEEVDIAHLYGGPFTQTVQHLKHCGTKVILTIAAHNIELSIEEHKKLGYEYPYVHITNPFLWEVYSRYIREADVVICPSKSSAEYLKQKLQPKGEVIVIPHGCYLPAKVEPIPEKFDVAYLGQFGPDKGLFHLIRAWSRLNFKEETLILSGDSGNKIANLLWYAEGKYHFTGYVPNVSEIYNKCSVYVQPSVTEAFGIPVLEAMAHGRPVIVAEGAGVHEIVEDGKEGFIVPIRDADSIAACIKHFHDSPEEVESMGANARRKAEQYTWEKIRKMYEEVYLQ
jgi:glycosyltransferase involved in cell wall biosynthesis